jgi:hypothetical protein
MKALMSRNEVAQLIGVSRKSVARNDARWGIRIYLVRLNPRVVGYKADETISTLRTLGYIK